MRRIVVLLVLFVVMLAAMPAFAGSTVNNTVVEMLQLEKVAGDDIFTVDADGKKRIKRHSLEDRNVFVVESNNEDSNDSNVQETRIGKSLLLAE